MILYIYMPESERRNRKTGIAGEPAVCPHAQRNGVRCSPNDHLDSGDVSERGPVLWFRSLGLGLGFGVQAVTYTMSVRTAL